MRGDQLARQWQLIQRLAVSRSGVGLDDLARDLECVRRTVYRDLDALMYAGFPVMSERRDGRVYYRFIESFKLDHVPFTPDEILALAFSEDLLQTLEGTVFHDSIRSALAKIRAGLGPELSSYLGKLTESIRVMPGPHKRYAQASDAIRALNDAILSRRTITIEYRTGRSGEERRRDLDPYKVWYRSGGLYVIGYDHRSSEIRTFAINRILSIDETNEPFEIRENFDFDSYTASAFGVIAQPATTVRIRFVAAWRAHVLEHTWHPSQKLSELPDGGVELRMEVGGSEELRNWVLSFGSGAEVLEPEDLRDDVRRELVAAAELYA